MIRTSTFFLILMLTALLPTAARAQNVPNGHFETWLSRNNGEVPQGWVTSDDFYMRLGVPFSFGTVTKSTTLHSGQFAARVASANLVGTIVPGILVLGDVNRLGSTFNPFFRGGIPFTGRPTQMQFWYRYTGAANDSANFYLELRQGRGTTLRQVGAGTHYLVSPAANTSTYTLATVPITYAPGGLVPDTLRIYLTVGSTRSSATAVLLFDDLSVSGGTGLATANAALAASLLVYPNPSASGEFMLRTAEPTLAGAAAEVCDALGRVVRHLPARDVSQAITERAIDLRGQAPGLYLLRLSTAAGTVTRQLVLE
jgi:hypothetical protein